jgi:hypothetical protein
MEVVGAEHPVEESFVNCRKTGEAWVITRKNEFAGSVN